jgi:hypothetical protein
MAELYPYKIYSYDGGGGPPSLDILPGTNTPYGNSEVNDISSLTNLSKSYLDYFKGWMSQGTARGDTQLYQRNFDSYNKYGGDTAYQKLSSIDPNNFTINDLSLYRTIFGDSLSKFSDQQLFDYLGGKTVDSNKYMDPNRPGVPLDASPEQTASINATHEAAVAAGTEIKVPIGSGFGYIPTNSPGGQLATGQQTQAQQIAQGANLPQNANTGPGIVGGSSGIGGAQGPVVPGQATSTQPTQPGQQAMAGQQADGLQMTMFYKPDPKSEQVYNAQGEAVSFDQYMAQGGTPNFSNVIAGKPPTPGQVAGATTEGQPQGSGLTSTPTQVKQSSAGPDPATDPIGYVNKLYEDINKSLGISSLKQQMESYNKQLLDLKNEKTDKISGINDNPWLTEGVRVSQIGKLDEKYEMRENNLLGYLQLSQSLYNSAISQAQNMAGDVMQIEQQNRQHSQDQADARFKLAQGSPFYKYPGSNQVFSTATGQGISYDQYVSLGGTGRPGAAFGDVFEINPQGDQEKALVMDLASKYVDAKILPSDSLAVAQSKLASSRIYQDQVRGPQGPSSDPLSQMIKALQIQKLQMELNGETPAGDLTVDQSKARQFATAAENANALLLKGNYNPGTVEPWLPNALKSSTRQEFEQAARAFVNATLRRESGATITDSEFENKYRELIPSAGDGSAVIDNKTAARAAAVDSIKQAGLMTTGTVAGASTESDPLGIR